MTFQQSDVGVIKKTPRFLFCYGMQCGRVFTCFFVKLRYRKTYGLSLVRFWFGFGLHSVL